MKKWDEKLADLSSRLADLSQKTADASADAKAARELKEEVIRDRISTAKGNVVALQENIRIATEEKKSRFSSALLKAQMTMEAKIQQRKEAKDKKHYENYIDEQLNYILDSFESASYLIQNAQLAILETVQAIDEYSAKYGDAEDEAEETETAEEAPETTEEAAEEQTEA